MFNFQIQYKSLHFRECRNKPIIDYAALKGYMYQGTIFDYREIVKNIMVFTKL